MTLVLLAVAALLVGLLCAWAGWRAISSGRFEGSESMNTMVTILAVGIFLTVDGVAGLIYLALR